MGGGYQSENSEYGVKLEILQGNLENGNQEGIQKF